MTEREKQGFSFLRSALSFLQEEGEIISWEEKYMSKETELIERFETELAILKESGKIKGYVIAVLPEPDGNPLIAANATSIECFGLAEAIKQHHINQTKESRGLL